VSRLKHPNRKLQNDQVIQLVSEYLAGSNIAQLAREFGMHEQTVKAHLRRADVELRSGRVFNADQAAEIAEAYVAGATIKQLIEHYGSSVNPIRRVLREAGVQMRPRGRQRSLP
jgi:Mor family transcriptional regulator